MILGDFTYTAKCGLGHIFLFVPAFFHFFIVNRDLFNSQEPVDENCYEQMKARPERYTNELQEATPPAQVSFVVCIKGQAQPGSQHGCMFQEYKSSTF